MPPSHGIGEVPTEPPKAWYHGFSANFEDSDLEAGDRLQYMVRLAYSNERTISLADYA